MKLLDDAVPCTAARNEPHPGRGSLAARITSEGASGEIQAPQSADDILAPLL